jgi:3-oxoadipate enol-lactonase
MASRRAIEPPVISDDQWRVDQEYVSARLRRRRIAEDWETEVFDEGEGEPLLCIPIVAHAEVVYALQLRDLGRDYRAITYRRTEGTDRPITLADRGQEVRRLLDGLGIDRTHVVARTEGAMVGAEFALRHPDRCTSLVLITLGMDYAAQGPVWLTNLTNWLALHLPIERLVGDDRMRRAVVKYLSGPEQRLTYGQLMQVYAQIPQFARMYRYSAVPLLLEHDLRRSAHRITAPTLLITSDEDPRATAADLEALCRALPNCRGTHVLANGGRLVNYVLGDAVNRLIRAFLEQLAETGPRPAAPSP